MDRNGEIDFPEFRHIFEDLKVDISEAKLRVYFQKCDLRNRGTLNYREFHTAMFTVNPINPKRSIRFAPGKYLSPHDIFSLFDTDKSQNIDRSEFSEMLRFMNYDSQDCNIFAKCGIFVVLKMYVVVITNGLELIRRMR